MSGDAFHVLLTSVMGLLVDDAAAAAGRAIMGRLHDHPVLQEVRARRDVACLSWPDMVGEAVEQVITAEQAQSLRAYFEGLRRQHPAAALPSLEPVAPGERWATVYGVRLVIEDRRPLIAEQHGSGGAGSLREIAAWMLPAGTARHRHTYVYLPRLTVGDLLPRARAEIAEALDAPHFVCVLEAGDLPPHAVPPELRRHGGRLVYGFTARAIPGRTPSIVIRPGSNLPGGWLHPGRSGRWEARGEIRDRVRLAAVHNLTARTLTAYATGRVEIRGREAAEIFEVTACAPTHPVARPEQFVAGLSPATTPLPDRPDESCSGSTCAEGASRSRRPDSLCPARGRGRER
ncbi:hypothetical protein ETD86_46575 [Nonomuraea turkmeniaca]|uniref:Uncharacterized protein n=1 Tax=Nonomuraea turkmeniaca TaxID=103838 RepID=A0A5S4EYN9_9ACTN|nr:hypothetical protein [Nonomuraea turkmeniaca]TMR08718.1 hypothetical protein ETD86_46575 [Nonomuraea turkmeniaca]